MKTIKKRSKNRYLSHFKERNNKAIVEKRYALLLAVICIILLILFVNLVHVQLMKQEFYQNKVKELSKNTVLGPTAPRGRIYDRNHKLIVNNKPVKAIYYKKLSGTTIEKELEIATSLAEYLVIDQELSDASLREYYAKKYPKEVEKKITEEEWRLLEERKITLKEINAMKLERITKEELAKIEDQEKEIAIIYTLMNTGYSYDEKIIKKEGLTEEEYAKVSQHLEELKGVSPRLDWERDYPYGSVFKTILGTVSTSNSGIPYEMKDYYLEKGYELNDRVGTSYLEYQYDDYLKGTKDVFSITNDGSLQLLKEGKRGNDLVLTIDIELQKAVEQILMEQLARAKTEPNTEYYNRSFVIITDPKTGEVLAMAGKQIVRNNQGKNEFYDYTPGVATSPVTVGSVIKGASHIVGYNTGALKIGEMRDDACIKVAATPEKCSWMYLGSLNDLTALKYSSNTYQFRTAINVGHGLYTYNGPLTVDESAFDTYRKTFAQFGLGVKTGIDLPVESLGYKGNSTLAGHLMDFAIGQYDTYTPIQLSQYVTTLASNGTRRQPFLLKAVYEPTTKLFEKSLFENKPKVLNQVDTKAEYFSRMKKGLQMVLEPGGTGYNYVDPMYKPAGKTGTSQSFIDTNNDGMIDKETITNTFVAYAPYDNPKVTFTVISPDISHYDNATEYQSNVNSRISYQVSKKFFEIYK